MKKWLSKKNIKTALIVLITVFFVGALIWRFSVGPRLISSRNTRLSESNLAKQIATFYKVLYSQIDKDKEKEALVVFGAPKDSADKTPIYFGLFDWISNNRSWQERFSLQLDLSKPEQLSDIKNKTSILVIKDLAHKGDKDLILTLRQIEKDNSLDTWVIHPTKTSAQVLLRIDLPQGAVSYKAGKITASSIIANTTDGTQKITTTYGWDGTKLKELETKREKQ